MRTAAPVVACFDVHDLKAGVLQHAAHPVDGPVVRPGHCVVELLAGLALEKANKQLRLA